MAPIPAVKTQAVQLFPTFRKKWGLKTADQSAYLEFRQQQQKKDENQEITVASKCAEALKTIAAVVAELDGIFTSEDAKQWSSLRPSH